MSIRLSSLLTASRLGIAALACLLSAAAVAQVATEISLGSGAPRGITAGPDGNVWFVVDATDAVGRVTPAGVVTLFTAGITTPALPESIVLGPDGNLWFTEQFGRIGRITPTGAVTEFSTGITPNSGPTGITVGPDGNLWFTERIGDRIGRITTAGVVTEFSTGITPGSNPYRITAGPDGNLWFTELNLQHVGRITTAGVVTEFGAGISPLTRLVDIVAGPDGNLWFTEVDAAKIGRITPAGVVTEFTTGIPSSPFGITVGPDGNFWFGNEGGVTGIGRMTPAGVVTFFSAGFTGTVYYATTGPDGNLWFTEPCCTIIGHLAPAALPTLSINNVSQNEGNSGTTPFTFTVTLSAASASTVTVNFATADGTATAPSDYAATSGTLTFAPGVTTQQITVDVVGDTNVEPNETFTVDLLSPTNATLATATGTGTIVNDDAAALPTLSINNVSANEGNSGTTPFTFTATLSAASASTVTVNFATADGSATAPSDYAATSGTLTFNPGVTTQTITVNVVGDTTPELNETFFVNLSAPTNATIATGQGIGTILNDDAPPPPPPPPTIDIPTLDEWAVAALSLLLFASAMIALRRRRH